MELESFGDLKKAFERKEKRRAYECALALAAEGKPCEAAALLEKQDLSDLPPDERRACGQCYAEAAKRAAARLDLVNAADWLRRALSLGFDSWHVHRRRKLVGQALRDPGLVKADADWVSRLACSDCDEESPTPLLCAKCVRAVRPPATMAHLLCVSRPYSLGVYRWQGDADAGNTLSRMIRFMKKQEGKQICHYLAYLLACALRKDTDLLGQADVLVAVPPDPERIRERGFDNVAELAINMEAFTLLPLASGVVRKTRPTEDLRRLPRSARRSALQGAFEVDGRKRDRVAGAAVLLVDDVLTSGSTLDTCAEMLLEAGAEKVLAATLARSESSRTSETKGIGDLTDWM